MPADRISVLDVRPCVDCGRWPAKACVGDRVSVSALVVRDGHETLRAVVRYAGGDGLWREEPLEPSGNDRYEGSFPVDAVGRWSFAVEAWVDRHAGWLVEHDRKLQAGQEDLSGELAEGEALFGRGTVGEWRVSAPAWRMRSGTRRRGAPSSRSRSSAPARAKARGTSSFPARGEGFRGVAAVVPALAELGFDVIYLPPIHPIGTTNRKGRNNAPTALAGEPGSPWAIGAAEGGHDAMHPELGTLADLEALVAVAQAHEMELALDFAIQTSPDHPWLTQHPEWFQRRPDGSLKFAENPPKRYQDIHNVNWETDDREGLWDALRDVVLHWCARRDQDLPGRQPAYQAGAVLGVAHRRGARRVPRRGLPLGGVHARGDDDDARQGRLLAELHVLHVEELEGGAHRARRRAPLVVGLPEPEPLAEHARHPARDAGRRRAARIRVAPRARGDALTELRHLLGVRGLRERPAARRAARSTWTPKSTRSSSARSKGRCFRCSSASTRCAARTRRSVAATGCDGSRR